jgi:AhpD family alkylhydroperoxidase
MATVRLGKDEPKDERIKVIFTELKKTLGFVPNFYRALANSPEVLDALWSARKRLMAPGHLDETSKQWLVFAALVLTNNQFSIHAHTARLKQKGVSDEAIVEALGILAYFSGCSVAANGMGLAQDHDPETMTGLRGK